MAISRSLMERQLRAGGGIMTLEEPRQGYFLGKIVKKAKRAVKKVVKSPLGKAALLGAGALYALGGGGHKYNFFWKIWRWILVLEAWINLGLNWLLLDQMEVCF